KRILVVDDEANIGLSLQMILEGESYNVLVCRSAADFRARITAYRADVCLIDVRLPDGNGIDLLRLLRQNDNRIPVVMISGHGSTRCEIGRSGAASRRIGYGERTARRTHPSRESICAGTFRQSELCGNSQRTARK